MKIYNIFCKEEISKDFATTASGLLSFKYVLFIIEMIAPNVHTNALTLI